jgi:tryptophan synthase beta chain
MNYRSDENGYYGRFGGAFIPEILHKNVSELKSSYLRIIGEDSFRQEYLSILKDYCGRPSPLTHAKRLSEKYGASVYLKREDLNHTGAHKINNTAGQILLAERMGKSRIIAETGAGQHGLATATVCALRNLKCVIFMGEEDIARQYLNVQKMKMLGAEIVPVSSGNGTLKDATNEAMRDWCNNPEDTFYIIGSVVGPHPYPDIVARFQSVISEEIKTQLKEKEGRENPDILMACVGGGSNAAGTFYHFLEDQRVRLVAAEAAGEGVDTDKSAATVALGREGVIHGSKTLLMQDEHGQIIEPYSVSAGLDYPGIGPQLAHLADTGRAEVIPVTDREALEAAMELTRTEGIIPALESSHALALLGKGIHKKGDIIVITVSGRGDKDMPAYLKYFDNESK